jgi:hypothetical protein
MSEGNLWNRVRENLKPFGRLVRVENHIEAGTPDVCYCLRRLPTLAKGTTGWLELKHVPQWPARPQTPLSVDKLTREQCDWHTWWSLAGGTSFTLLQVHRTLLLLNHKTLAQVHNREHTQASLRFEAIFAVDNTFPTAELVKCLTAT